MKRLVHIVATALLLAGVACGGENEVTQSSTHYLYDMVTYVDSNATTGEITWELVGRDHSTTRLRGFTMLAQGTERLQRMLLRYNYDDEKAGTVKVYGTSNVFTDSLRVASQPIDHYAKRPIKTRSMWRTGDYINLHCQVEYTGKARTMTLLLDDATSNRDTVECYLCHDLRTDTAYFWRECYASFNVGNVWKRPQCTTLRVHVIDNDLGNRTHDFAK